MDRLVNNNDLLIKFGSEYSREEEQMILEVLRKQAPTSGEYCLQFEKDFSAFVGTDFARVVSNGTAALFLSMVALNIGPGDHVITTPLTWIATAAAPVTLGADIDFVDIDPLTYNMDVSLLGEKIKPNTKAIIPVHLYGQICDMEPLLALSEKHGFAIVEDACHAVGATYKSQMAGSFGNLGCFSFHEQKNMSTLGEGGMVVTDDPHLYERVALYRSHCTRVHGRSTKYCQLDEQIFPVGKKFWWQDFDDCGYNFRMTDIQAAVGMIQLKKLEELNQRRIRNAAYLEANLEEIEGLTMPAVMPGNKHVFHLFPVMIEAAAFGMNKEDFIYDMYHRFGIRIGYHYIPLHWTTAFKQRGFKKGQFPNADRAGEQLITLPINPRQTEETLDTLINCIRKVSGRN